MSAHTPGPWQVIGSTVYGNALRARLPHNGADARLIAAAPDLLAALREVLPYINDDPNRPDGPIARAVAAIAKAERGAA